jgi:hypothetical protein
VPIYHDLLGPVPFVLGDSQSRFCAFRNSAIAEHTFDLRMRQNCIPDRNDCCVCLCEHQVGKNQIQETGSDLFLGLLVFMENRYPDFPRNWCLWYAFLGKIDSHKKNQKSALGTILRALWYTTLLVLPHIFRINTHDFRKSTIGAIWFRNKVGFFVCLNEFFFQQPF